MITFSQVTKSNAGILSTHSINHTFGKHEWDSERVGPLLKFVCNETTIEPDLFVAVRL